MVATVAVECRKRYAGLRRGLLLFVVLLITVLAMVVGLPGMGQAQAKDWRIDAMDVVLDVQRNGDVVVDERVTFTFQGNYHYVSRSIPTGNTDGITDVEVRDASGTVLPEDPDGSPGTYSAATEGKRRLIRFNFDLTDATETWTIHYRARSVVMFFDQGDELRWYVFDAETPVPIGSVRATVKLPGSVASTDMTQAVQTGYDVAAAVTSPAPSTMVYEATGIPPYTNFWIVTGFPKGVVEFTWTVRRVAAFLVPKVGFALPILFFLFMLLTWRRRGRDDPSAVHATYVSEPPSDLSPGLVGALIDERVDTKEVIATIVDLARRGYLEITDTEKDGLFSRPETIFTRRRRLNDLTGFEARVAEALFDAKHPDQVTTKDLKNHFYVHVQPIVEQVYNETTGAGLFFESPKKVRARWTGYGVLAAVILGGLTALMAYTDVPGWGWFLVGSIVSVVIVWVFARFMPQRTSRGAQEQRKWEAFRNYLEDLTRFQDMETAREKFEMFLPYAVALGVERQWVRRFDGLNVPGPVWYHPVFVPMWGGSGSAGTGGSGGDVGRDLAGDPSGGGSLGGGVPGGGFGLDTISDGLFSSLSNVSSVLTSAPSSSGSGRGSSGGSGGGFSGGGGGGGFSAG